MTMKTQTTELLFPIYKQDPETQHRVKHCGHETFSPFVGLPGLQFFAHGTVIYDDGKPLESNERGALLLEWDDPSSFYAFFPSSPRFLDFVKVAGTLVAVRDTPELFATITSARQSAEAAFTQVIKVKQGPVTETVWSRLCNVLRGKGQDGSAPLVFSYATGLEAQEGVFLGMVGWERIEDYERVRESEDVVGLLQELSASGKVLDIVVKVEPMSV